MVTEKKAYQNLGKDQWQKLQSTIGQYLETHIGPHYAAFDADGTLWDRDAGEAFFQYQIDNSHLDLPNDPWKHYHTWKESDPRAAYLWLAQINKGQTIQQVRTWAKDCLKNASPWPIFDEQARLVSWLRSQGVRVFIVTASITWAVEPIAALLGLHYDDVLGVETQVINSLVTDQKNGQITWKEGKAQRILQMTDGIKPLLCSGNTMGDFHLLKEAQLISLAVGASQPGDELYETEESLRKEARKYSWWVHQF